MLAALAAGTFQHEARRGIDVKKLLQTGAVTAQEVVQVVSRCNGSHYVASPHHAVKQIEVHVLKRDGWYIKFYFVDPDTIFISVHR
ncbi:hypothetical protein [Metarhizobium album]|uniref:hypothetical protein n=1 Tax=Metarhizobium album TaxID=2182425 RepID=UPI00197F3DF2|nr:hypothetical protein [Rhizobium album]